METERAAPEVIADAVADRRDEVARHRAANHGVGKIKSLAARARPHGDLDVAELTMAARLLFITGVLVNRFGDGLTVGGLRRRSVDG